MRWVLSRREPTGTRLLLIESGSRSIMENAITLIRSTWGAELPVDLLTCYEGLPSGLGKETKVFHVADYGTPALRRTLLGELGDRDYAFAGMICAAEPVMSKWKWWAAAKVPAKFFVINENGDYFWLNRENAASIKNFALVRMGLSGAGAIRTLGRLLIFPFSVLYLLLYAGAVHLRRAIRLSRLTT